MEIYQFLQATPIQIPGTFRIRGIQTDLDPMTSPGGARLMSR